MAIISSILAWKNSMDWWATVFGVAKSQTQLSTNSHTHTYLIMLQQKGKTIAMSEFLLQSGNDLNFNTPLKGNTKSFSLVSYCILQRFQIVKPIICSFSQLEKLKVHVADMYYHLVLGTEMQNTLFLLRIQNVHWIQNSKSQVYIKAGIFAKRKLAKSHKLLPKERVYEQSYKR